MCNDYVFTGGTINQTTTVEKPRFDRVLAHQEHVWRYEDGLCYTLATPVNSLTLSEALFVHINAKVWRRLVSEDIKQPNTCLHNIARRVLYYERRLSASTSCNDHMFG
jgi:hypothetical protein